MTAQHERATVETWLADPLPADVAKSIERIAETHDVHCVAVLPDVHLAGDVCVGTVVATSRRLLPAAVGGEGSTGSPRNRAFTESRTRTMIVKTPSTVPTGMKRHSTPPMTRQKV